VLDVPLSIKNHQLETRKKKLDVPSTTILPHSSPRMPRIFFFISLYAY
jgi:hypothetical protein